MDIKDVRIFVPLLHSMGRCKGNCERNILMSHLDDKSFKFMCHWLRKGVTDPSVLNLSQKKLGTLRKVLKRDKDRLKYITTSGGGSGKINHSRRVAVRQSGEGIGMLLGALAPVLINLVRKLVTKKKKR